MRKGKKGKIVATAGVKMQYKTQKYQVQQSLFRILFSRISGSVFNFDEADSSKSEPEIST